jgi:hypothetical protein
MSIAKAYARELREQTGYSATWWPHVPVAIGEVGRLHNNEWTRFTTLDALGIPFTADEGSTADIIYASQNAVKVSGGATGSTSGATTSVGKVDGTLHIEFNREGAMVFETAGTRSRRMQDSHSVGRQIIERFHAGVWEPDYVVVTEVLTAASAVVLVSSGRGGVVDLAASADVAPSLGSLAKLGAQLKLASAQNIGVRILGSEPLTPLFKAFRVKDRWFGTTTLEPKRSAADEEPLVRTDYDDFDDE